MKPLYRIDRILTDGHRDSLCRLWEGDDLPAFRVARPYLFECEQNAKRVCYRLQARYPDTFATPHFPPRPILYQVVPVQCHYTTHIGMDFKNDHADLFCVQLVGHDDTAHAIVNITNGLVTQVQTVTSLSLRQSALIRLALMHYRRARAVAVA